MKRRSKRCRYGKLKHARGRRICKLRGKRVRHHKRRRSARRARKSGSGLGMTALIVGALGGLVLLSGVAVTATSPVSVPAPPA